MPSIIIRYVFCVITLLSISSPAMAGEISGKVVRIVDGDTIVLLTADHHQEKISLAGIDAPERKQAFGKKSKDATRSYNACYMIRYQLSPFTSLSKF